MRILAIDPGYERSAFVIFDGVPINFGILPNHQLLSGIRNSANKHDCAVIEMVACYGMAVGKEVFETVFWAGRFHEAILSADGTFAQCHRLVRRDVKMHLCNNNAAKDGNIRQALIDKFGPGKEKAIGLKKKQGPLYGISNDVWAALALAVTWSDKNP